MKKLLLGTMLLALLGCESDPYPTDENLTKNRRPSNSERRIAYSLAVPESVKLTEGIRTDIKIKFEVPEGENEVIEVEGLPAGATFDKSTYVISWTPGFFDGNDPSDPRINQQAYEVKVRLFTDNVDDPAKATSETITLNVHDKPQLFEVDSDDTDSVVEGSTLNYYFDIDNLDYPDGPFDISLEGMPANTKIEQLSERRYKLVYTPDYHHVKNNESNSRCNYSNCSVKYEGKIIVANPANHKTEKEVELKVMDKRQDVSLIAPQKMEQGLDISFQITAFDTNGEVAPRISFDSKRPIDGEFSTNLVTDTENNSSVLNVVWKDIPPSYNGKVFNFDFEACTLARGSASSYNNCESTSYRVEIKVKQRSAPVFARNGWKAGEIKYLKFNEEETYSISIRDGDKYARKIDNIKIVPEEMSKYVTFTRERLSVKFDKPGIHQFSIVATSEYNMSTAQSFVAEVFKETRSKTIYLTNTHKDPEAKFFTKNMTNVELINPYFQRMDKRMLSGRDQLILGTNILQDREFINVIEAAMKSIDEVIIATPMIENMPQKFLDDLHQKYKVAIDGRYLDIAKTPLSEMKFISRSDFEDSLDTIQLKETTTFASHNPTIFSIGVDRRDCQDVLDLTDKNKTLRYKMGIICDREEGGRFAILGTEFSDFKTTQRDESIPAKWLRRMLSTRLNTKKGGK